MMHSVTDKHEANRLASTLKLLRDKLLFWMPGEGDYGSTLLHGFTATRREQEERFAWGQRKPVVGLVVQGSRSLEIGDKKYQCGECCCFMDGLCSTETSRITQASSRLPYLALSLELDRCMLQGLVKEESFLISPQDFLQTPVVAKADIGVLDAFFRLVKLIDHPEHFFYLSPLIVKEIHYRILVGPLGKNVWLSQANCPPASACISPL